MIIVIADDITGAAEIAGIALKHGLDTVLTTQMSMPENVPEVLVIATDTRSGNEQEAKKTIQTTAEMIRKSGSNIIFKKTDSVLRGHITAELSVLMDCLEYDNSLLIPQNPSKGRIIKNGKYLINGIPLDKTDFKYDPEFPARSSCVKELLRDKAMSLGIKEDTLQKGIIYIADAENDNEIKAQLDKSTAKTLLAGGADLFTALLQHKLKKDISSTNNTITDTPDNAIIICGSTQSKNITKEPYIKKLNAYEEIMPYSVFNDGSPEAWINKLADTYATHRAIIIGIGDKENGGKDCAIRLRNIMAEATQRLVEGAQPELMIIEGGATAYAILSNIGWKSFKLKNEYAPGIVSMTYGKTEIILKPGSYPWGNLFNNKA